MRALLKRVVGAAVVAELATIGAAYYGFHRVNTDPEFRAWVDANAPPEVLDAFSAAVEALGYDLPADPQAQGPSGGEAARRRLGPRPPPSNPRPSAVARCLLRWRRVCRRSCGAARSRWRSTSPPTTSRPSRPPPPCSRSSRAARTSPCGTTPRPTARAPPSRTPSPRAGTRSPRGSRRTSEGLPRDGTSRRGRALRRVPRRRRRRALRRRVHPLPWRLTAHYRAMTGPHAADERRAGGAPASRAQSRATRTSAAKAHFFNALKEATHVSRGSAKPVMAMSRAARENLWRSVVEGDRALADAAEEELEAAAARGESSSDQAPRSRALPATTRRNGGAKPRRAPPRAYVGVRPRRGCGAAAGAFGRGMTCACIPRPWSWTPTGRARSATRLASVCVDDARGRPRRRAHAGAARRAGRRS